LGNEAFATQEKKLQVPSYFQKAFVLNVSKCLSMKNWLFKAILSYKLSLDITTRKESNKKMIITVKGKYHFAFFLKILKEIEH